MCIRDRCECFFDFVYSPVYNTENKIIGVSVVATEVTSHVNSEKELVASEIRFKELILNADYSTAIYRGCLLYTSRCV